MPKTRNEKNESINFFCKWWCFEGGWLSVRDVGVSDGDGCGGGCAWGKRVTWPWDPSRLILWWFPFVLLTTTTTTTTTKATRSAFQWKRKLLRIKKKFLFSSSWLPRVPTFLTSTSSIDIMCAGGERGGGRCRVREREWGERERERRVRERSWDSKDQDIRGRVGQGVTACFYF